MSEQTFPVTDDEIHAYVDGALPEARRADVERELERNPDLAARVSDYFALNGLLHERYERVLSEPLPVNLRPAPEAVRRRGAANWPRFAGSFAARFAANFAGMAATLVLGVGIGWGLHYGAGTMGAASSSESGLRMTSADGSELFARQAALAHVVYMPEVERPGNMTRAPEQDFVQWLANRLGTDVHPPMLGKSGFELAGGRLLPGTDGAQVAQFMYNNARGERVTLCISRRKISSNTTAFKLYRDGPVNVFYWVDGDFGYALSSGIDRRELLQLAHDVYSQLTVEKAE